MIHRFHRILSLWTVLVFALPASAVGEGTPRRTVVLVLRECCPHDVWPELDRRILRELSLTGMNVIVDDDDFDGVDPAAELRKRAEKERADAAVTLYRGDGGVTVELAVVDETANRIRSKTLRLDIEPALDNVEIAALRAQEAVRAALTEETMTGGEVPSQEQAPGEAGPTGDGTPPAEPRKTRWRLDTAFLGQWAPGGIGLRGAVSAGGMWLSSVGVGIGVSGRVSVVGREVTRPAADARASFDIASARAHLSWLPRPLGVVQPALGVAAGIGYVWTRGSSETIDDVKTERAALFYVGGHLESAFTLTERVVFPLFLDVGVMPPGISLRLAGESAARLGMPLIEVGLGVGVKL